MSLINLEFIIIDGLHDRISFLAKLREERDVVHIVIIDVLNQVWLDHATRDGV